MFKNSWNLSKFALKTSRKLIIAWSVSMFLIMFLYMILFPSMQEMATVKMEAMPEEIMQFMGMSDFASLNDFVAYFGMIYNLMLIAICIFGTTFSANLVRNEEKEKTIEFTYALEVSRAEIFISKIITAYIALMIVLASTAFSTILCGFINGGETFVLMDVVQIVKISSIGSIFFLSVGFLLSGFSFKFGTASSCSMFVIFSYVISFLANLIGEENSWLKYLSPFNILSPENALVLDEKTMFFSILYITISAIFCIVGVFFYKKRDLSI